MGGVLRAVAGVGPPPHAAVLDPPAPLLAAPPPPPPDGGKVQQGGGWDHTLDSENFSVAWQDGDATRAEAEAASQALEEGWQALVEDGGWRAPVSSERFLIWAVLEPNMSAAGYTTEYANSAWPDGYPAIFLNPAASGDRDQWAHVATHELVHAVQFAYRDVNGGAREPWYWEASAEWGAALARPDLAVFAESSVGFATAPAVDHWSMDGAHPYGMFLLNAALEEQVAGEGAMKRAWERGATHPEEGWDEVLARVSGASAATLFGAMAVAAVEGSLADSDLYMAPQADGVFANDVEGSTGWLGARYYSVPEDGTARVTALTGDAVVAGARGVGPSIQVHAGDRVAILGTADADNRFVLTLDAPVGGGGSGEILEGEDQEHEGGVLPAGFLEEDGGCSHLPGSPARWTSLLWSVLGLLLVGRRRRGTGPGARSRTAGNVCRAPRRTPASRR
jgi:hypothetical protein